jgi:hypothetical protein
MCQKVANPGIVIRSERPDKDPPVTFPENEMALPLRIVGAKR